MQIRKHWSKVVFVTQMVFWVATCINEFTLPAKYLPRYFTVLNLHSIKINKFFSISYERQAIETISSCWWKNIQFLLHILKTAFLIRKGINAAVWKWFSLKFQFKFIHCSWNFQLYEIKVGNSNFKYEILKKKSTMLIALTRFRSF